MPKYGFAEMEVGEWKFYPYMNSTQHERMRNAAYMWAYRNKAKMEVRKGESEGIPGVWVHRVERDEPMFSYDREPEVGEVQTGPEGRWDLDRLVRDGVLFVELSSRPDDYEINGKVQSLRRAIRNCEKKNGIEILHFPELVKADEDTPAVFGWILKVR